jgi:hypothetical protein
MARIFHGPSRSELQEGSIIPASYQRRRSFVAGFCESAVFNLIMHLRHVVFIPAAAALLLVGCSSTTAPATAAKPNPSSAVAVVGTGPETTLTRGLTADEVRRIMGEPDKIDPAPSLADKAEVWIYHRVAYGPSQQIEIPGQDMYRTVHQQFNETIQVLMMDGMYLTYKNSVLKEQVTE